MGCLVLCRCRAAKVNVGESEDWWSGQKDVVKWEDGMSGLGGWNGRRGRNW
jgi:hypothetical protein